MSEVQGEQVEQVAKIYLRYEKKTATFEFKLGTGGESVKFPEVMLPQMRAAMQAAPMDFVKDAKLMVESFDLLVTQAKEDPDERFVSVSSAEIEAGQATIGGSGK